MRHGLPIELTAREFNLLAHLMRHPMSAFTREELLEPLTATSTILAVVLLVTSPVQPWYAVVLAGLGCLVGAPWLMLPAFLAEPYYAAVILDSPRQVATGQLCYSAAAAAVIVMSARNMRTRRSDPGRRTVHPAAA